MDSDLKSVAKSECLKANKISLNSGKTELVLFKSKDKKITKNMNFRISGQKINLISQIKYLWLILNEHLTFKYHLQNLKLKLNRANCLLSKIRLCQIPLTTISLEPWLQFSQTGPSFLKYHKMNLLKSWNIFKKYLALGSGAYKLHLGHLGLEDISCHKSKTLSPTGFKLAIHNSQFAKCFGSLRMHLGIFSKICKSLKSELFIELAT